MSWDVLVIFAHEIELVAHLDHEADLPRLQFWAQLVIFVAHRLHLLRTSCRRCRLTPTREVMPLADLGCNEVEKRVNWKVITERFLNGDEVLPFTPLQPEN